MWKMRWERNYFITRKRILLSNEKSLKRQVHTKIRLVLVNLAKFCNSANRLIGIFQDFIAVVLANLRIFNFLTPCLLLFHKIE